MATPAPAVTGWVRAGLIALPVYGLVVAITTRSPQPDSETEPAEWAEFVNSTSYLVEHVAGNVVGALLVIAGTAALGAFLVLRGPVARPALWGTVLAVAGQVLLMVPGTISTFGTPPIGAAYLDGHREVMEIEFSGVMDVIVLLALLLVVSGNVVLGVAVWRSGLLPRWTGALWVVATLVFYLLGAALGMATTGASLLTQPAGGLLLAVSGGGIAAAALRTPAARTTARASAS